MRRFVTITSGKGGVGKTSICLNMAIHLAALGRKTCVFDADLGLANINILLGIHPASDISDLLFRGKRAGDIIISHQSGVDILPGSSGVEEIANLESDRLAGLLDAFAEIGPYDVLFFDTAAGISRDVIAFSLASSEVVVILTPEPTSLTDAYALLKVLGHNGFTGRIRIIVNQCRNAGQAKQVYRKFRSAVTRYLEVEIEPLGVIYHDPLVAEAVKEQQPLVQLFPDSIAAACIRNLAVRLMEGGPGRFESPDMRTFWRKWLDLFAGPLSIPGRTRREDGPGFDPDDRKETAGKDPAAMVEKAAAPRPAPGGDRPEAADQGLLDMMARIHEGILSVSEELRLVRKAMELDFQNRPGDYGAPRRRGQGGRSRISLDLEGFLARRAEKSGKDA